MGIIIGTRKPGYITGWGQIRIAQLHRETRLKQHGFLYRPLGDQGMGACNFYSHAGIVVDIDAVVPRKPEFTVFYDKIPLGITDVKAVCGSGNAPGGARPDGDLTAFEMQAMDIPVSYETASGGGINGDRIRYGALPCS